jgi:hypothetical protein
MTAMSPIMRGDVCCGFLLRRGRGGVEGYDANAAPIGIFETEERAARGVLAASEAEEKVNET